MGWATEGSAPDFDADFAFSQRFIPAMTRILADHLIVQSTITQDRREATDLVILQCDGFRIACRVRRHKRRARYGHQFTIRTDRPSGARTELQKVLAGWGDYLIYGFVDVDERTFDHWLLGDLDVFRRWYARCDTPPGDDEENPDLSSHFRAFRPDLIFRSDDGAEDRSIHRRNPWLFLNATSALRRPHPSAQPMVCLGRRWRAALGR